MTIFTNCSFTETLNLTTNVYLNVDPEVSIEGISSCETYEGQAIFENLIIMTEGTYKMQATAENIQKAVSDEFTINSLYLKVGLIGLEVRII